jgi:hypothetical protein
VEYYVNGSKIAESLNTLIGGLATASEVYPGVVDFGPPLGGEVGLMDDFSYEIEYL